MKNKLNIKNGDTVMIMTGDKDTNRGKTGKVIGVSPKEGKVIVEGRNMVSKHVKPRKAGDPSGIVKAESAIYACKVQIVCPKCNKPTRVGKKINEDGTKDRICKKCGATL
ncbi:MAG TPA: 50S ribosomal protein L24 [Firmicutes bacterium]|nr:50S ribosomal protein L24 [Bacillota bacterium]